MLLVDFDQISVAVHVDTTGATLRNALHTDYSILPQAAECVRKSVDCFAIRLDEPLVTLALPGVLMGRPGGWWMAWFLFFL